MTADEVANTNEEFLDRDDEGYDDDEYEDGRLEGLRILIVDDDRDVLQTFDVALRAEGALTITASDGNTGLKRAEEDHPDVVVLDMMLPGRSGLFALEKIKGKEDSPQVIMVTANDGRRHQQYAEQMGADGYMLKPVPLGQLISKIEALTGRG